MKKRTLTDILYDYALYFIIGILLLVIIAMEPSFVRLSNVTTILTQSATKIIYACGVAGIIVLGGTDLEACWKRGGRVLLTAPWVRIMLWTPLLPA